MSVEVTNDLDNLKATAERLNLSPWIADVEDWHNRLHAGLHLTEPFYWADTDMRTLHNLSTGYGHVPDERQQDNDVIEFSVEVEDFVEKHFLCDEEDEPCGDGECTGACGIYG